MPNQKHEIHLSPTERKKLLAIVSKGRNKAVVIQRAHILLKADEGKTDTEIKDMLYVSEQTIRRTRLRYVQEGLQVALEDQPHAPQTTTALDEKQEAYLIALACSTPPEGYARGTLELLAQRLTTDGIVSSISPETVRLALKKQTEALAGQELVLAPDYVEISSADGTHSALVSTTLHPPASAGVF